MIFFSIWKICRISHFKFITWNICKFHHDWCRSNFDLTLSHEMNISFLSLQSGGHFEIKNPSYKYRNSHYKDKSCLYNGNPILGKRHLSRNGTSMTAWQLTRSCDEGSNALKIGVVISLDPEKTCQQLYKCILQTYFINCCLDPQNPNWYQVHIGSGNYLVSSGTRPSPESMFTKIFVVVRRH